MIESRYFKKHCRKRRSAVSRCRGFAIRDLHNKKNAAAEDDFNTYLKKSEREGKKIDTEFERASAGTAGLYYLHGDHLGTASYVTDGNGETTQFFLNLPFGEAMAEQNLPGAYENPYRFNAKELDRETNLYYYGARYYNPKLSIWYGVDPLAVYNPVMETEFYGDWQHNGGVGFWGNLNPYIYTYQNPIKYIDPNGKQVMAPGLSGANLDLDDLSKAGEATWFALKNMAVGVKNTTSAVYNSVVNRNSTYSAAEDDFEPVDFVGAGKQIYNTIKNGSNAERWQLVGSVTFTVALSRSLKGGAVTKVELMGGESSTLRGYINYDSVAKIGIADDVAKFGNYFKAGSLRNVVVNNPQAAFIEEISASIAKGGQVTIRGTMSNKFFNSIWNGKAQGLNGFKTIYKAENVSNPGYLQSGGKVIQGKINEITIQKK